MSRRSTLLASAVALSSLMGIDHATAMNLGGFGGGQIGHATTFNRPAFSGTMRAAPSQPVANLAPSARAPSIAPRAPEGGIAGTHLQPLHAPAGASVAEGPYVHPQQPAATGTSSGFGEHRPVGDGAANATIANGPAAAIVAAHSAALRPNGVDTSGSADAGQRRPFEGSNPATGTVANGPSDAAIIAAHSADARGKLLRPDSDSQAPRINDKPLAAGSSSDNGQGTKIGNADTSGPQINLPGTPTKQNRPGTVPGFDGTGNGPSVNLPGATDQHDPTEVAKIIAKMDSQSQGLVDRASQGPQTNTPSSPDNGTTAADDDTGNTNATNNGGSGGNGGKGKGKGGGSNGSNGSTNSGSNGTSGSTSSGSNASTGGNGVVNTGSGSGSTTKWKGKDGSVNTTTLIVDNDGQSANMTTVTVDKKGNTTTTYSTINYNTGVMNSTTISAVTIKKGNRPGDDDTGSVTTGGQLSSHSGIARRDYGDGTGNNDTEGSGTQSSQLAVGSAYTRKGYGDGTGDDGGENTGHGNEGALASGSALARKDYGDGGDTRGGDGTSQLLGGLKVGSGGSDPHQNSRQAVSGMTK